MSETLRLGAASAELLVVGEEGRIGGFVAETQADGTALIAQACEILREKGCTRALGPIGADTWGPYRLVIESDGTPAFPGEPDTPEYDVACFAENGFAPVQTYLSTIDTDMTPPTRGPLPGLTIGEWGGGDADADMAAIHALSNAAFAGAPFFAPIDLARFTALQAPLLAAIPSRYALVGRNGNGDIVACLLGYPSTAGLVLKSLMSGMAGAGSALVDEFYRRAIADGHKAVIHALMHEDNRSRKMSEKRHGRVFRRYALFGRAL